jgi:hypothetical protein
VARLIEQGLVDHARDRRQVAPGRIHDRASSPPPSDTGRVSAHLIASGEVRLATTSVSQLAPPVRRELSSAEVLDDLRSDF